MDSGQVLVIGVDTSVPPRPSALEKWMMKKRDLEEGLKTEEPMIVGICANYLKNPFKFCGDYYFQPCKHDVLEPIALKAKINWVLQKVAKERNKLPSIIFIIRDGVSEGMVPDNVHQEYPAYVEACRAFNQNWHPKFVYCIVDKKHKKRFFVGGKDQQMQNTMPGCVIDSKVVRVDLHEFWLQAHVPLQGTSKIPQYLFPVNQIKANNKELQGFLLAMCNNWQIVSLATALPAPVRQAGELTKRGHNNYMELKRNPKLVPRLPGSQQIDFQALNIRLCYSDHSLSNTRFNA